MAMRGTDISLSLVVTGETGHGARNKLELKMREQRLEEEESVKIILKEGEKEWRLLSVRIKQEAWRKEYYYLRYGKLICSMKKLDLDEVMVMDVDDGIYIYVYPLSYTM